MSLNSLYQKKKTVFSYELFPPKTESGEKKLYEHVEKLCQFGPDFITCTYGAGGSTRTKTLEIVTHVKQKFNVPVASHLTLVGSTVEQLCDYLQQAKQQGVDFIVALRGDPPQGEKKFQPVAGGLQYANELVELIRQEFADAFSIAVAGYPEKHLEAASLESDLQNLKRKVDAGADVVITQLFYHNDDFYQFRDRCLDLGIEVPIVPGVLPVTNFKQIQRITNLCGAELPSSFVDRLAKNADPQYQYEVGIEFATEQILDLLNHDVPGIHFYVLNQSKATIQVLSQVPLGTESRAD